MNQTKLLAPPDLTVLDVNLISVIFTVRLGVYYLRQTEQTERRNYSPSIVITASASSFQDFGVGDYTIAKHGVLGILRGLCTDLQVSSNSRKQTQMKGLARQIVRLNAIAPSWTNTGIVDGRILRGLGVRVQEPEAVARSVVCCLRIRKGIGRSFIVGKGGSVRLIGGRGGLLAGARRFVRGGGAVMERLKGKL